MIRIAHIISGDLWAGAESQVETLFRAFSADPDYELDAILLNPGELANRLSALGVRVSVIPENTFSFPALLSQVTSTLQALAPDIVHSHRYKENLLAALCRARRPRPKLIQTVHGTQEIFSGWRDVKATTYRALDYAAAQLAFSGIIAVSSDLQSTLSKRYPRQTIFCIHNAVDVEGITAQLSAGKLRSELKLGATVPIVGFCGRLVPIKGLDILIRAFQNCLQEDPQAHCVIIGAGPLATELAALVSALGINANVHFLGQRNDWIELVSDLDIMVLPSLHEGIPMTLLEAMSAGTACIASNVGGIPEVIEHQVSGLLVPASNSSALAESIHSLMASATERKRLGEKARSRIINHFSMHTLHAKMRACYSQLVSP